MIRSKLARAVMLAAFSAALWLPFRHLHPVAVVAVTFLAGWELADNSKRLAASTWRTARTEDDR